MGHEKNIIKSLVIAARLDLKRGIKREDILNSLSNLLSRELFNKVKDKI